MGKARSYEIIEYRKKINDEICQSQELVKLLGCENEEYPEDIIPYNFSFPHEYIPETIKETKRFINYEISATIDPINNVFKDLTVYFFVVCHEDVIQYKEKGRTYLWYDKVVCELDNVFSEKNIVISLNTLFFGSIFAFMSKLIYLFVSFIVSGMYS